MNKVMLIGRLTKEPDVRYTQGAEPMAIARFTLAVDRKRKRDAEQSADFIQCVAFGKNGEFVEKYLNKGTKIALEGHWQTGSYTNRDNHKVYTNDCVVESMEFAESKKANESHGNESQHSQGYDGFMNIPEGIEEELPFN